jgi:hypothetical protein
MLNNIHRQSILALALATGPLTARGVADARTRMGEQAPHPRSVSVTLEFLREHGYTTFVIRSNQRYWVLTERGHNEARALGAGLEVA